MGLVGLAGLAGFDSLILVAKRMQLGIRVTHFLILGVDFAVWGLAFGTLGQHFEGLGVPRVSKEST